MSNVNDRQSILERVRALSEMANPENGAFPQEIKTATAMMQKLMDQYQISLSEVMNTEGRNAEQFVATSGEVMISNMKAWHWALARAIARMTGTKHYGSMTYGVSARQKLFRKDKKSWGRVMSFFGAKDATEMAAFLYDKWVVLIDHMGQEATKEYCQEVCDDRGVKSAFHVQYEDPEDHPNVWRNSWLQGVTSGIMSVIREKEEERDKNTETAIVLVKDAVEAAYEEHSSGFKTVKNRGAGNFGAYRQGQKKGRSLDLNQRELGG